MSLVCKSVWQSATTPVVLEGQAFGNLAVQIFLTPACATQS